MLDASDNALSELNGPWLDELKSCPKLEELWLEGNPVASKR